MLAAQHLGTAVHGLALLSVKDSAESPALRGVLFLEPGVCASRASVEEGVRSCGRAGRLTELFGADLGVGGLRTRRRRPGGQTVVAERFERAVAHCHALALWEGLWAFVFLE